MLEMTLEVGDRLLIGEDVLLEILPKMHPKAIPAQVVRIGIQASDDIFIEKSF
jgi:hypothetical protein